MAAVARHIAIRQGSGDGDLQEALRPARAAAAPPMVSSDLSFTYERKPSAVPSVSPQPALPASPAVNCFSAGGGVAFDLLDSSVASGPATISKQLTSLRSKLAQRRTSEKLNSVSVERPSPATIDGRSSRSQGARRPYVALPRRDVSADAMRSATQARVDALAAAVHHIPTAFNQTTAVPHVWSADPAMLTDSRREVPAPRRTSSAAAKRCGTTSKMRGRRTGGRSVAPPPPPPRELPDWNSNTLTSRFFDPTLDTRRRRPQSSTTGRAGMPGARPAHASVVTDVSRTGNASFHARRVDGAGDASFTSHAHSTNSGVQHSYVSLRDRARDVATVASHAHARAGADTDAADAHSEAASWVAGGSSERTRVTHVPTTAAERAAQLARVYGAAAGKAMTDRLMKRSVATRKLPLEQYTSTGRPVDSHGRYTGGGGGDGSSLDVSAHTHTGHAEDTIDASDADMGNTSVESHQPRVGMEGVGPSLSHTPTPTRAHPLPMHMRVKEVSPPRAASAMPAETTFAPFATVPAPRAMGIAFLPLTPQEATSSRIQEHVMHADSASRQKQPGGRPFVEHEGAGGRRRHSGVDKGDDEAEVLAGVAAMQHPQLTSNLKSMPRVGTNRSPSEGTGGESARQHDGTATSAAPQDDSVLRVVSDAARLASAVASSQDLTELLRRLDAVSSVQEEVLARVMLEEVERAEGSGRGDEYRDGLGVEAAIAIHGGIGIPEAYSYAGVRGVSNNQGLASGTAGGSASGTDAYTNAPAGLQPDPERKPARQHSHAAATASAPQLLPTIVTDGRLHFPATIDSLCPPADYLHARRPVPVTDATAQQLLAHQAAMQRYNDVNGATLKAAGLDPVAIESQCVDYILQHVLQQFSGDLDAVIEEVTSALLESA